MSTTQCLPAIRDDHDSDAPLGDEASEKAAHQAASIKQLENRLAAMGADLGRRWDSADYEAPPRRSRPWRKGTNQGRGRSQDGPSRSSRFRRPSA